jgi:DNA-binding CsgD family transcriptional regulator
MSLGLPWADGVPPGPDASALVVDPSPLLREALAARLRALGAREVEEAAALEEARGLKTSSLTTVADGLRAALAGELFADPGIATSLAQGLTQAGAEEAVDELSARERDILRLVADGHTNKEIGETVDLPALTVKSHLARIARSLGTGDRAHMVALGLRSGVIS